MPLALLQVNNAQFCFVYIIIYLLDVTHILAEISHILFI